MHQPTVSPARALPRVLARVLFLGLLAGPGLHAQELPDEVALAEALRLFHLRSPRIEIARARLRSESAAARQGTVIPNPALSATHEDLGAYSKSYLLLNQPLAFLWDRGARQERADALTRESRARFAADSARLATSAKEAFVEAWAARSTVEALATADGVLRDLVGDAEARVAEGDLAGYDLRRLRWERVRVGRRLALAEVALEDAERALGDLLSDGREGSMGARVAAVGLEPGGAPDPGPDDLVARALARRAELAAAEASVRALEGETGLTGRSWLAGTNATGGMKTQSDGADGWFVGLQVPLPLSDRRRAARESAIAAVDEARARLDALRRSVVLEVERARARLESLRRQADLVAPAGDDGAEALLDIARLSYAEGEIGIVELLDAADAWLEARLTGDRIRAEAWTAYFELEAAVGGFDPLAPTGGNDR